MPSSTVARGGEARRRPLAAALEPVVAGLGAWARPVLHRLQGKLLGRPYDGSAAARARMARQLPIVRLREVTR
ncbi:hypothetical protein ACFVYA_44825 [Amycolatopsis sp. NPDC058278]|uniref:hypothetical protein n=1 Tax=Amycolatopsis sp. NPDC058278 TaxID=3346417 RepID=UPI0036DA818D